MNVAGTPPLVALVDDHALLSAALAAALTAEGFAVLLPRATTPEELRSELCGAAPAVTLLDLDLGPLGHGRDLVAPITAAGSRVIIVSGTSDEGDVGRCLEAGAAGWVPKMSPIDQLLTAVRCAVEGRPVIPPQVNLRLLEAWRVQRSERSAALRPFGVLSPREREVLGLLREGMTAERIARATYVSVATVRSHIKSILAKLGVSSQLEAVALARRAGWVSPVAPPPALLRAQ